jgi:hypothetical protein
MSQAPSGESAIWRAADLRRQRQVRQISAIYSGLVAGAKILINRQLFIDSVDGTG